MTASTTKSYQQDVLDSTKAYFERIHEDGDANLAFYSVTHDLWGRGSPYNSLAGFAEDMPYFCLRVPTGGGKTFIAARAVSLVNRDLLRQEHSVILWLVPSKAIRDQTLQALKSRSHPYHAALKEAGAIAVYDLEEARCVTRATLETSTVVIVATRQAFQVEDKESRKVYEQSGALMPHFDGLTPEQRANLLPNQPVESFANMLRLRRPFIIVDEAHNSRTELSFDTLAGFRPSGILELTATPDTEKTPSNVLHSVSAAELKAMEMIKLPIQLETEPDWQRCLNYAIDTRNQLDEIARQEERAGAAHLRPIVLIQAEKRHQNKDTLDVERVREELIHNQNIPEEEILVATGEQKGLETLTKDFKGGILSPKCPVKYVLTQQALAEGWDCPFAYILVSMADIRSATSVEQLLGRVLRQPGAERRVNPALNQSYAYVVSRDFSATAASLRDRLVQDAGFDAREADAFVTAKRPEQQRLDIHRRSQRIEIRPVVVPLPEKPDIKSLPKALKAKVSWDAKAKELKISEPITEDEAESLSGSVLMELSKESLSRGVEASRTEAIKIFETPSQQSIPFCVPELAVWVNGELQLFDDPQVLDYPYDLPTYQAVPDEDDLAALELSGRPGEADQIDIDEKGHLRRMFIEDLERDLALSYTPEHWDETKLAAWLCRNLRMIDCVTHASMIAFVSNWLGRLLDKEGFDLARANRQKFLLRQLLESRIKTELKLAAQKAYQQFLFAEDPKERVSVGDSYLFTFNPDTYVPSQEHPTPEEFQYHYYPQVGAFDTNEEYLLANWLDQQAHKGRIRFWVRNLVRKPGVSFFLQTATDRFYPDFVCMLPDGAILVVENKGADRWKESENDRKIGQLWAEMSGGRCRFVMVKEKRWEGIDALLD